MSEFKTECKTCIRKILQRTFGKYHGMCVPCYREVNSSGGIHLDVQLDAPLSSAALDYLIIASPINAVIETLFLFAFRNICQSKELSEGDIIIYTIHTFYNETYNGDIIPYLGSDAAKWADHCGPSLRKINADKYADVLEECINEFTNAKSSKDPEWETDLDEYIDIKIDNRNDPFDGIQQRLRYFIAQDESELRKLLYKYICSNRSLFTSSAFNGN